MSSFFINFYVNHIIRSSIFYQVKHKDPKWLPTAFLINKISDILFSHEKLLQQKTETYIDKVKLSIEKSMKNTASEVDEKPSDTSKTNTQLKVVVTTDKNEKASKKLTDDGLVQVYHDRKYSLQSTQKKVGEEEKTRRHTHQSLTCEGLHTGEQHVVTRKDNTVSICSKDKHVFRVEGQKQDYTINEDIKLKFLKFCNDGARCNAWSDNIHAFLTDRKGRVDTFNVFKVSDGGWLLSCKAKCEGPLTATVKANEKPITSFDIDVYSIFTDPIEV